MFAKAKRFDVLAKNAAKDVIKVPTENLKPKQNTLIQTPKPKPIVPSSNVKNFDSQSVCSSVKSTRSFVTPKPVKIQVKAPSSLKKPSFSTSKKNEVKSTVTGKALSDDIIKSQEVEIRNKDQTITEYCHLIEELKVEISKLQKQIQYNDKNGVDEIKDLRHKVSEICISETDQSKNVPLDLSENILFINDLKHQISVLEFQCNQLEEEVSNKQVELTSLEEVISIRDSLCKDLQDKLTNMETCLEENKQRLEMVKGHHALALEANESIRREYKAELETLKAKLEDEKHTIYNKCKSEQDAFKAKYNTMIETIKEQLIKEKETEVHDLKQKLISKENEMKAKLEQIDEATHEKLRLCEIQFEERCRSIQDHWALQEEKVEYLEKEANDLKCSLSVANEKSVMLQKEINTLRNECDMLMTEKCSLVKEVDDLKDESKKKYIDFENQVNKLTVKVDNAMKEKSKYEMSLTVTRDIVEVLKMRLRESDDEVERLERKVKMLIEENDTVKGELCGYKGSLNNTIMECNEYKEALVNILKSKATLAKEHNRIMEHNVSLIESLQNVEKEAYRELGTIKNELIEDVQILKKESNSQIKQLRDEVEKKRALCEIATEHASQAAAAAEQSRVLLGQAAAEISRLEAENVMLNNQIQDQQSLVVELSLLRQENEELSVTIAKQTSIIEKIKKDAEMKQAKPKSPSVIRKSHKIGKENAQIIISPLRERNH